MPTLEFKGKPFVYAHHLAVPYRTLEVNAAKSASPAPHLDENLIIHGDNLHALKALLPRYAGRVKCIYIDPPYNTGNEGWCYNDAVNAPLIREWLKDSANPVDKEDLERHDKWLCMMWPRLQLLRELLADDGVIFVSIDDNEVHHLRMIMDEVFGEENFIAQMIWASGRKNDSTLVSVSHEYLLCYAKNIMRMKDQKVQWRNRKKGIEDIYKKEKQLKRKYGEDCEGATKELRKWFSDMDDSNPAKRHKHFSCMDDVGIYFPDNISWPGGGGPTYEVLHPKTNKPCKVPSRGWMFSKPETMQDAIDNNRVHFGLDENYVPCIKSYLKDREEEVPYSVFYQDGRSSTKRLRSLMNGDVFSHPKDEYVIQSILEFATEKDDIILDSFAGSGTTAHAVLALNKEDGGNRKFILVECEDYADTITAERVRRVIRGVPGAKDAALQAGLGGTFTFCELGAAMDVDNLLKGQNLPSYAELSAYVFHTATGATLSAPPGAGGQDYFIGETATQRLHLIYRPDLDFLRSGDSALSMPLAERIGAAAKEAGKGALVFATHKFMGQDALTPLGITFAQLPYALHRRMEGGDGA